MTISPSESFTHCARCGAQLTELDGVYCASCSIQVMDETVLTLDVAGIVRQVAGLPPHMEVMAQAEDGSVWFVKPGSVGSVEDASNGQPIYLLNIREFED